MFLLGVEGCAVRVPLISVSAILISIGSPLHLVHLCSCFVLSLMQYWIRASQEKGEKSKTKNLTPRKQPCLYNSEPDHIRRQGGLFTHSIVYRFRLQFDPQLGQ